MRSLGVGIISLTFLTCTHVCAAEMQNAEPSINNTTSSPGTGKQMDENSFLATNKTKPGVVTLPDGLQYKVIQEGTGPKPTANDLVTVDYAVP